MQIKSAAPDKFTKEQQERLSDVAEKVIDLEEQIELAPDEQPAVKSENGYTPKPGTENLIHASIIRGRRFDENTGVEISTPYVQTFTFGEYENFKKNASLIGYTIVKELYNPFK